MPKLANRAKVFTYTVGSGSIVLADVVSGHQSFGDAGVETGDVVSYAIEEGASWEIGTGVYTASSTSMTRVPLASSNGGNHIVLAGNAVVYVTALADDIVTPSSLAAVATSGAYSDLTGVPTLVESVRTLWVDPAGDDSADGDLPTAPLATVGAAVTKAEPGDIIRVRSGTYTESCPLVLPRDVSVFGDGLRNVEIRPTEATDTNNIWLVDSGAYLWGMTFAQHQAGSFAVAFNTAADNTAIGASGPGAFISKSPYIQNCSSYTAAQDDGTAGSTSVGTTGAGMEVDGAKCAPNSPIRSMVVDSYTQVNLNGLGCVVKNDAYAQLVSFFGTFCSTHVRVESGGQVNLSNSTTNFGTYGLVADGRSSTPIFSGTAAAAADAATTVTVGSMTASRIGPSSRPAAGMVFEVASTTYTVTGALPNGTGWDVNFYPTLDGALSGGETVEFFQRSQISTGGHVMEFVGSGTNYNALPWFGGVPIPANEIVEGNGGRVFFSSTDQLGNFRVGPQFDVNGTTGAVTINTDQFNLSGLNAIGPFSRDGFTSVGVQLREVSNNASLLSSTGAADGNTAPTQFAIKTYLDENYTASSALATVATSGAYGDLSSLPTLGTAAATAATDYATAAQGALADTATQPEDLATVATSGAYGDLSSLPTLGTAAATAATDYATAAQGALADTATQPEDLATVATSGAYGDLSSLPTLGTAAATAATDYATAAQGALADTATQPEDLATVATSGAYGDLSSLPTLGTAAALDVGVSANDVIKLDGSARLPAVDGSQLLNVGGGGDGDVVGPASAVDGHVVLFDGASGKLIKSAGSTLATVATSGAYGDLSSLPTLGTAAATAATDYATAAQGALADTATQPEDLATVATSGAYGDLTGAPSLGTLSTQDADAVIFTGSITEGIFVVTGTTPALDPANGTIQTWTLSGPSTPTDSFSAGESLTLMVADGASNTITWPAITWVNNGALAPTLATSGYTVISLWKISTTLYGALVGDGS